ncbi:MAG: protein kinase domain-containing protein [Pseudomonadales bacterium]
MKIEIPGYTIHKAIGHGGMATVYHAHQHNFDSEVAIKILDVNLLRNEEFGQRFIREARIMRRLRQNNIVLVHDVGRHGDIYFIAMEYLAGGDLQSHMQDRELELPAACDIIRQIAAALDCAHDLGYVHRDVKPANILFRSTGEAVLTDFGIARTIDFADGITHTGTVMGTPKYMSPEQATGEQVDSRSDIYSLGVVFYELLTGVVPYSSTSPLTIAIKHVSDPIPELAPEFAAFQSVIDRILAKKPEDRYQTGAQFVAAIESILTTGCVGKDTLLLDQAASFSALQRPPDGAKPSKITSSNHAVNAPTVLAKPSNRKPGKPVVWFAAACVLLVAVFVGLFYADDYFDEPNELSAAQLESVAAEIKAFVEEGEQQFNAGKFAAAETSYQKALAFNVSNKDAKRGLQQIAENYAQKAELAIEQGNIDQAQQSLMDLLRVQPRHEALAGLQRGLHAAISERDAAAKERQADAQEIASLLEKAKQAFSQGLLISPLDNNAYNHYQNVFAIDINNADAKSGIHAIGSQLLNQSRRQINAGNLAEASNSIKTIMRIAPEHPELEAVRQQLRAKENAVAERKSESERLERQRRTEIASLLKAAEDAYDQDRLSSPKGDNAYEKYQNVLAIDSNNQKAKLGLLNIKQKHLLMLERSMGKKDYDEATRVLSTLINIAPNHESISKWQTRLKEEKRALENEREKQELIAKYIKSATLAYDAKNLDAALGSYQKVLSVDADNDAARAGITNVIDGYMSSIERLLKRNRFDEAEKTLAKVIKIAPDHTKLRAAQNALFSGKQEYVRAKEKRKQKALEEKNRLIAQLLREADSAVKNKQYVQPEGRSAVDKYKAVLEHDPKNAAATKGLGDMFTTYLRAAESDITEGRVEVAGKNMDVLQKIDARDKRLFAIKARFEKLQFEQQQAQRREQQFSALLSEVNALLGAEALTQQTVTDAIAQINLAEEIMPGDDRLKQGRKKVTAAYYKLAAQQKAESNFDQALKLVASGLEYKADNAELLQLREDISASVAEKKKRKKSSRTFSSF